MKRTTWMIGLLAYLFSAAVMAIPPSSAADAPGVVVGRVYHIEGDLLRYVPEVNDWVAVVKDAPFGAGDALFSGTSGMGELIVPNGTWIRVGNSTQLQVIALDADLSEMDVATGVARFYNKGYDTVIRATSPFGYVLADSGAVFDFYVGENSVEVFAVRGKVSFVHTATDARYEVSAGSPSIIADQMQVSLDEGGVDPEWNRWNNFRESYWATKTSVRGRSVEYLPSNLWDEAYALKENGRWESVFYEGQPRWFWRPTTVVAGWSPFTVGRWTYWYGDQCWIPAEPFGYLTHHYGNWVYARNSWYWAPPVVSLRVGLPLLDIGYFWYPGRVSWIYSGLYVGWVPLAPREMYYGHRHWGGRHMTVVTGRNIPYVNIRNHAYVHHAVLVDQNHFSRVNNYRDVRVHMNRAAIINNFRGAPVVNNTVINNYTTNRQRHNFTNVAVREKPHNTVLRRIERNETIIRDGRRDNAAAIQERAKNARQGSFNREARIQPPRSTNYIVPANEVNRPKSEIKLQQRAIKSGPAVQKARPDSDRVEPARPAQPEPARQERAIPAKPAQPEQSRPERAIPAKPAQPEPARPERAIPTRPAQPEPTRQERAVPSRPAQPEPARQERAIPARPAQPEPARPERAIPSRPAQPEPARQERAVPARPAQPEPARPERALPARPAQPEPTRQERAVPARPAQPEPARPERALPARPAQPEPTRQERAIPARPAQPEPVRQERAIPARPVQQPEPARQERAVPARPAQHEQSRQERAIPARPAQPEPARQERAIPARPAHPEPARPAQPEQSRPERVTPVRPAQPEHTRPERVAPTRPGQKEAPVQPEAENNPLWKNPERSNRWNGR